LCTQAPDFILPTTACLLQHRLGLRRDIGAMDINLGCSGFVYGLSIAAGLIAAGAASNVLLLTADTYSKYIHDRDKSVRTLFGDGAAATMIARDATGRIGPFVFGTDGSGANDLVVEAGGFRTPRCAETALEAEDSAGNVRSREHLFMHGANVMNFSLREVPRTYRSLLERSGVGADRIDYVVLHQANKFMLDALQRKLGVPAEMLPRRYEDVGNTVSSTIPFVLADLQGNGQMAPGTHLMLIGFGVGLSWAGASVVC
jgi:3-oxoacyl-[acyl-carrier-protein] synthase-3